MESLKITKTSTLPLIDLRFDIVTLTGSAELNFSDEPFNYES